MKKVNHIWGIWANDGGLTTHAFFTKKEAIEELKDCNRLGCYRDGAIVVKLVIDEAVKR